ncbi:class I SAM-dependent methyltransferase [Bradyrhizobium sp.]|uniref:class I SAM-dependent methyltransferase n=1 Tax=Bradyrhizobium sp. TaxID=376 RepID=UPI00262575F6|nr:class I SAM-dependent methyltransferase [Bradyrhizobium sp.]
MKVLYLKDYPSFGDFDQACFRNILAELTVDSPTIVEVGSWLGSGSTQILIEHVKRFRGRLHCVDTWEGSSSVPEHAELLATYDVYESFWENVRRAGGADRVEAHRMPSTIAAACFADRSVDMVFIDADHAYDCVRADILAWRRKVRLGGILCGHDCETRVTEANRDLLWKARNGDHIPGGPLFRDWHPGVILAVDEVFGGAARLWAEKGVTLPDGRHGPGTLWDLTST